MKIIICSLLFIFTGLTSAQEIDEIFAALGSGDVNTLSTFLDQRAEVHIEDKISEYDKSSGVHALNNFFASHKPISYKKIHSGASKAKDSLYSIGQLRTNNGNYRVYLYVKREQASLLIEELRFDVDNEE